MMPLQRERAIDIFDAFLRAVEQSKYIWHKFSDEPAPNVDKIFTDGLIAMGSDGASVMVGVNNGFHRHLEEHYGRKLILVHCLTHRLDLAVKPTRTEDRDTPYQKLYFTVDSLLKDIRRFFSPKATKRLHVLKEVAKHFKVAPRTVLRLHDVRWTDSMRRALTNLLEGYPVLVNAFEQIIADRHQFTANEKMLARTYAYIMSDSTVYATLLYFADLLNAITKQSKLYQQSLGNVMDLSRYQAHFNSDLWTLNNDPLAPDTWLQRFTNPLYVKCLSATASQQVFTTCRSD
ncbi:hypothetical protein QR680_010006 [Steinernema hermaphroditum]|uniref:DUF4371 domain-containing protein n=1 Tax=Steinernema hermaphroditum TaxID=289476 RepID=A0AA39IME4_9BILA|nr:hypothetical protein QR680_010006 [Steinernema hermaphroditum]